MITKLKKIVMAGLALGILSVPIMAPAMVFADATSDTIGGACNGVNLNAQNLSSDTSGSASTCGNAAANGNNVTNIIKLIINIFSLIVGVVAIIMIIIGGLKYITSGGDSGNITGAKNTILYAIIGLVVVALAQFIVRFVLTKVGSSVGSGGQ